MTPELQQLLDGIAALEAQRPTLGDAVVDAMQLAVRNRLAALMATDADGQTLRLVSILFLDIVGSTALSQHLDPEDIHGVMDGALQRATDVVTAHGGKVLQYAGDNLLAAFGAERAQEDDAERAVRCGLALARLGRALGREVLARHGHAGFDVRIGVHTGSVLLGGGVDAAGTIRGIAVNIAARMEQTAPPGGVRISQATHSLVRGLFDVEAQAPLVVKGVDTPVHSVLVARARPREFHAAARGLDGANAPMLGRDSELQALQAAFGELATTRSARQVLVVGDAGLGKSRLLAEFDRWATQQPQRPAVLRGRATPQSQSRPFALLADLFSRHIGLADDEPVATVKDRLEQAVRALFSDDGSDTATAHAHLLGHLIGVDWQDSPHISGIAHDPRQIRSRALHAAALVLERVARAHGGGLVLQLEDLHWADDDSLGFLDSLAGLLPGLPMLRLALCRPTLFERRPDWAAARPDTLRLDLQPLDAATCQHLVQALLTRLGTVPPALSALVATRGDGNPFYIEELIKMLLDQGAITAEGEHWTLHPERLNDTDVPESLAGVLEARLDSLPADEHRTLQEASIIGPLFWEPPLRLLDSGAPFTLPLLARRTLVLPQAHGDGDGHAEHHAEGLRAYAFKHQVLHQVTYETVLRRHRRTAHAQVAQWLAGRPGLVRHELIAEHFERGGEPASAVPHWHRAAEAAAARYANDAALAHARRALAGLGDHATDDEARRAQRWDVTLLMAKVLRTMAERDTLAQCLDDLAAQAERLRDDARRSEAAERRARFHSDGGDAAQALALARQALAWAPAAVPECAARAQLLITSTLSVLGRAAEAQPHALAGLAQARAAGLPAVEAMLLNQLGMDANERGDPGAAMALFEQALTHHRTARNRSNEAGTLTNLAYAAFVLGQYDHAQAQFAQAELIARQIGHRPVEGIAQVNQALVRDCLGDSAGARQLGQSAVALLRAAADQVGLAAALRVAGHGELGCGLADQAAASFAESRAILEALGLPHLALETVAGQARLALAAGDLSTALDHVSLILQRLDDGASLAGTDEPMRIRLVCAEVLLAAADNRASAVLDSAHHDLAARAQRIADPLLRQSFLDQVPWHQALTRLAQQRQPR